MQCDCCLEFKITQNLVVEIRSSPTEIFTLQPANYHVVVLEIPGNRY